MSFWEELRQEIVLRVKLFALGSILILLYLAFGIGFLNLLGFLIFDIFPAVFKGLSGMVEWLETAELENSLDEDNVSATYHIENKWGIKITWLGIRHILDNTPYIVFLMVFTFGAMWPLEKIQEIREELKDKLKELRSKEVDRNR
tara:strand:+ start:104 stop:538 length:435 start_codon:yes stop_codon:yes gene_type:complete